MVGDSIEKRRDLKELLRQYGISFDRPAIYEFPSILLPWFSSKNKTNIEIEIVNNDENEGYTFHVLLVPDLEGIVERTVVFASNIDAKLSSKHMFIAKFVKENLIPELNDFVFSEQHNAYSTSDPYLFTTALTKLLA